MFKIKFCLFILKTFVLLVCLLFPVVNSAAQDKPKVKLDEIIAKHIASIGTTEALAIAANRIIQGKSQARDVRSTVTTIQGKAALYSTVGKSLIQMKFRVENTSDYSGEHIGFDGKKLNIPFSTESGRSAFGAFLFEYPELTKQGLIGGSLMSSWALLDAKNKISKFEYNGNEKVGDVETYVLRCTPRGGTGLTIKLYFDAQTYRHIRTTYYREITPPVTVADEGRVSSVRYKLVEDFLNYTQISGLSLPTTYKIDYTFESPRRLSQFEWLIKLSRFEFNQQLASELFQ